MKSKDFSRFCLTAVLTIVFILGFVSPSIADAEVTGVVKELGFNKFVMVGSGSNTATTYNTGRETQYSPSDYRVLAGDTITINYYEKTARSGNIILAVSSVLLKNSDPNRKDLVSPAVGIVKEVGRSKIRINYPEYNKTLSWPKKRGIKMTPTGYAPQVGDKVEVHFEKVTNRWTKQSGYVINAMKKIK